MAISYLFDTVQVHIFEYNILPQLLIAPQNCLTNPDFQFLVEEKAYNKFQAITNKVIKTNSFICQPYPPTNIRESSFWQRYGGPGTEYKGSFWGFQIPFLLRLRKQSLEVLAVPESDRPKVEIDSCLYLNAFGWSTHVNMLFHIPLRPSQLADLCDTLRDKAYGPPPYRLNGKDYKLKELFKFYRQTLLAEIFAPNVIYYRPDNIPHLVFIDVIHSNGQMTRYPQIPLSILGQFAKTVRRNNPHITMKSEEGGLEPVIEKMMITDIENDKYNFSITDFDQGVFTFLQRHALSPSVVPYCYARNVIDCFLRSYFLLAAWQKIAFEVGTKTAIYRLLERQRTALRRVRDLYTGRTALRLLYNHKGIVEMLNFKAPRVPRTSTRFAKTNDD
jgi:hypothetical protein